MPLAELLPIDDRTAQWGVWATTARVVVRDPADLAQARAITEQLLAAVDAAASRFRPDSEVSRLDAREGAPTQVSPLLAELVGVALRARDETDGAVDPGLGRVLAGLGYDRDYAALPAVAAAPTGSALSRLRVTTPSSRPRVTLAGDTVTVPAGMTLDLGATAKAWTSDRAAGRIAAATGRGVLVALGGDIATAAADVGQDEGWDVLVQDGPGEPAQVVHLTAGHALATSSTLSRRWRQAGDTYHHVLDPRTLRPATPALRTVSVAAPTCLQANVLTTAAVVFGADARRWLAGRGAAARIVGADGTTVHVGGWPAHGEGTS